MTTYAQVVTGLHVRFATVTGIAVLLKYAPTAIHDTPTLYSLLDGAEISRSGQVQARRFRIINRLCVPWQDNEQAELEIMPFVDSIPAAVDADPHLGGVLTSGYAEIVEIDAGWVNIAGVEYRMVDFIASVLVK